MGKGKRRRELEQAARRADHATWKKRLGVGAALLAAGVAGTLYLARKPDYEQRAPIHIDAGPVELLQPSVRHDIDLNTLPFKLTYALPEAEASSAVANIELKEYCMKTIKERGIPAELGTPQGLELVINKSTSTTEMMELPSAEFKEYTERCIDLIQYTVELLKGAGYYAPSGSINCVKEIPEDVVPSARFMRTGIPMYIIKESTLHTNGTLFLRGTGHQRMEVTCEWNFPRGGNTNKQYQIKSDEKGLNITLCYQPITLKWLGVNVNGFDACISEYLHCVTGMITVKHAGDVAYAVMDKGHRLTMGEWRALYEPHDRLEEAVVHGISHKVVEDWCATKGMSTGDHRMQTYTGVEAALKLCQEKGIVEVLKMYRDDEAGLARLVGLELK